MDTNSLQEFFRENRDEIFLVIVTALVTFVFTKMLPSLLSFLRKFVRYTWATVCGRRRYYRFEDKYLKFLVNSCQYLSAVPSRIVDPTKVPPPPKLERIYINLELELAGGGYDRLVVQDMLRPGSKTVVLGDPGTGKTTMVRYLCLTLATLRTIPFWGRRRRELKSRLPLSHPRIPVLVYLSQAISKKGSKDHVSIISAAKGSLPEDLRSTYPDGYFEKLLDRGKCAVLLDGLDEIPSKVARAGIARDISSLADSSNNENVWVVTSRIVGYTSDLDQHGFSTAIVKELTPSQVERFVLDWYQIQCERQGYPPSELEYQKNQHRLRANHLVNMLKWNHGLSSLATNPMLVSLIALLHSVRLELPENRALLYRDCLDLLVERWDAYRGLREQECVPLTTDQKLTLLKQVARQMHDDHAHEIPKSELSASLTSGLASLSISNYKSMVEPLIHNLEQRAGLLIRRGTTPSGEPLVAFSHLTFQEYLTALCLLDSPDTLSTDILTEHFMDSWWREPILLCVAQMENPLTLIEKVYDKSLQSNTIGTLLLASSCVSETQVDKRSELVRDIFSDVAFLYLYGEAERFSTDYLKHDRYNNIIRLVTDSLLRMQEECGELMEILLQQRRGVKTEPDRVISVLTKLLARDQISPEALAFCTVTSKYVELPVNSIVSFATRTGVLLQVRENSVSAQKLKPSTISAALPDNCDWNKIVPVLECLAPLIPVENAPSKVEDNEWRTQTVSLILRKYQLGCEREREPPEDCGSLLDQIRSGDYAPAFDAYRKLRRRFKFTENELSTLVSSYHNTKNASLQRFIIMCLGRMLPESLSSKGMACLMHFVVETVCCGQMSKNSGQAAMSNNGSSKRQKVEIASSLEDLPERLALVRRCLDILSDCSDGTHQFVELLLTCYKSNSREAVDFAINRMNRLEAVDERSIQLCMDILDAGEPKDVWAALQIISAVKRRNDEIIPRLVPYLCDRENSFHGRSVRDAAVWSSLRLLAS